MNVLFFVLPLALLLAGLALWACVRSIQSGQFDDLETPALRMLTDDVRRRSATLEEAGATPSEPRDRH